MKKQMNIDRREFIKKSALAGAAFGVVGPYSISRASKISPNDKVVVAVMGGRARAGVLADAFASVESTEVKSVFDVDERPLAEKAAEIEEIQGRKPEYGTDFRKALDDPDIDALVIGAPDHWHTPATIMALQAGKHVYVEKPASHNPREAELVVHAQNRYDRLVQMGNQQRSDDLTKQAIQEIHDGIIGNAYFGKAFYAHARDSIGHGSIAPVPDWLDYELWQGPAPRTPYRDNLIHYNWHWFWKWGTGEILNNATHEYDLCRWALGVELPTRIVSAGGRFHFDDDWEFYDTQDVTFEFGENKAINWEGRSSNGFPMWDRGRGAVIHGTEGTVLLDRDGYIVYDLDNEEVKREMKDDDGDGALDVVGGGAMTNSHIDNFAKAIREGTPLNSPINEGQKSILPLHLGNISQYFGRALNLNPGNGRIIGDSEAMSKWSRDYEPGWEPRI